ncbi:peptidylprolyl isomerase [Actinosynnema sp. NPDC020468]|uniref:peptidylprolyl isomerase n=1 Tax=Actinosynnema sp. NPDC020468 TaxID=3154488 RepID=UPI0034036B26
MSRRLLASALPLLLLSAGCAQSVIGSPVADPNPEFPPVDCEYTKDTSTAAAKPVEPPADGKVESYGTHTFVVKTNQGEMEFELDAKSAPCTVHSFKYLVEKQYYLGTSCHRLTVQAFYLLQCGDAGATGRGTPGYQYDDPTATKTGFSRAVIAMANTREAGTNGSQFFIMHKDSLDITPDFPVFGTVTKGMSVIDKVAAGGVAKGTGSSDGEGRPSTPLKFESISEK